MTRRVFYWSWGVLYLASQTGYFYFSFIYLNRSLAFNFLIGSTILTAVFIAEVLYQSWPPKNTMRRTIYWFGTTLFVVFEADFFIARSSPSSPLLRASFIGSIILVTAFAVDLIIQNWQPISAFIKKLRRPPIDE